MKKVAVILSGSGVYDGAEIHESVITILALDRRGAEIQCCAPDIPQMHVVNHLTGKPTDETRNVLVEAARIARGDIKDLADVSVEDFDAAIFPGGFGAAKNLCDFAVRGPLCTVNPVVDTFVKNALQAGKVLGFLCIAPALAAKIAGSIDLHPELTIGSDRDTAAAVEKMGGRHVSSSVSDIVVDARHKIVTTAAYMLGRRIGEVAEGIEKLVDKVLELC